MTVVTDVIAGVWRRCGSRVAIRTSASTLSFAELLAGSEALSRALAGAVREPGQRVALVAPNSAAFVAAFVGAARVGGVVAPVDPRATGVELAAALAAADPVAVVTTTELAGDVSAALASVHPAPAVVVVSASATVEIVRKGERRGRALPTGESPPLLQQSTSGSTGPPKRVVRTHAAVAAELAALRTALGAREDDRFVGIAPFSHVNGLVRTMLTSMAAGAELHPVETFHRRDTLDTLARGRITVLGAVPRVFVLLAGTPARGAVDLGALRLAFSSSAPLRPDDNRAFARRYGVVVRQLYGTTETGSIAYDAADDPATSLDSVGRPLAGVTVDVVDDHGHPAHAGAEGEIVVASPFAAREYLDDAAATAASFRAGAYRTGDLGRVDGAGRLVLTGRRSVVINRGGYKVNPYEVEAVLRGFPKVEDVVVFGVAGAHGDEAVACVIVPAAACTVDEILEHCRSSLADYKIPSRIEFRTTLPTGVSGKVLRERVARP